jgi:hypothetical protein
LTFFVIASRVVGMVNKKRGRPKGKKNTPTTTLVPLSILNMIVGQDELVRVSIEWLSSKSKNINKSTPDPDIQKESEQKIEFKITNFNE